MLNIGSKQSIKLMGILIILLFIGLPAKANIKLTVKVMVVGTTCSVTELGGGTQTAISFGDVLLEQVKSARVKKQTNLHITCDGPAPIGKVLNLTLKQPTGTMPYDGRQVLRTTMPHLGIGLVLGDSDTFQPMNTSIPVSIPSSGNIKFGGILVTDNADKLQAGSFTAAVSVVAAYI